MKKLLLISFLLSTSIFAGDAGILYKCESNNKNLSIAELFIPNAVAANSVAKLKLFDKRILLKDKLRKDLKFTSIRIYQIPNGGVLEGTHPVYELTGNKEYDRATLELKILSTKLTLTQNELGNATYDTFNCNFPN